MGKISIMEEVLKLQSIFFTFENELISSIENLEFELYRFSSLDSFTGTTANNVKLYINDIHLSICKEYKNILYSLLDTIKILTTEYFEEVDNSSTSKIYEEVLYESETTTKDYLNKFENIDTSINSILSSISDIVTISKPNNIELISALHEANIVATETKTSILSYDQKNNTAFDKILDRLTTIDNLINSLANNDNISINSSYNSTSMNSNNFYTALLNNLNSSSSINVNDVVYYEGLPSEPNLFFDNDFPYDPNFKPSASDYANYLKWQTILLGADVLQYLPDGCEAYAHYLQESGKDLTIDFEKAYRQDENIKTSVDYKINEGLYAAISYYKSTGKNFFQITGDATSNSISIY